MVDQSIADRLDLSLSFPFSGCPFCLSTLCPSSFSFLPASRGGIRHARSAHRCIPLLSCKTVFVAFPVVTSFVTSLDTRVTNYQLSASVALVPPVQNSPSLPFLCFTISTLSSLPLLYPKPLKRFFSSLFFARVK